MTLRQLQPEESRPATTASTPLPSMTEAETREVIALWTEERFPNANRPTLSAVAEGLDIPPSEAGRLLSEVQARRLDAARSEAERLREATEHAESAARLAEAEARLAEAEARKRAAERQATTARLNQHGETGLVGMQVPRSNRFVAVILAIAMILFVLTFTLLAVVRTPPLPPPPVAVPQRFEPLVAPIPPPAIPQPQVIR